MIPLQQNKPFLMISGMHRSGTSLASRYLAACGLNLGESLIGSRPSNPDGHYEHAPLVSLHDQLLQARRCSMYQAPDPGDCEWNSAEQSRALAVIEALHKNGIQAVKDPRTTLFLKQWAELMPNACFVLLWREASEVCDSLRRRGDARLHKRLPFGPQLRALGFDTFAYRRAIEMWCAYNERILQYAEQAPERLLVLSVRSLTDQPEFITDTLMRWGFDIHKADINALMRQDRLISRPSARCKDASRCQSVARIHDALEAVSMDWQGTDG